MKVQIPPIGRYPTDSPYVDVTIWQMYLRHRQVAGHEKCGQCQHFIQTHTHCGLFDSGYVEPTSWADWSAEWLACGAFWAHEGEVDE